MKIIIRCDASFAIGTGHIVRCLTLADCLAMRGDSVEFISRAFKGNIIAEIERRGYRVHTLPDIFNGKNGGTVSLGASHSCWDEFSVDQEIDELSSTLAKSELFDWLVVDHYGLGSVWERSMRTFARRIMVIDDLADRVHDCDLLVDQNLYENMEERYNELLPPHCVRFLGPRYSLLRPEFAEARKKLRKRNGIVRRIIVFFGGADITNETAKALDALAAFNNPDIAIDVVVGVSNPMAGEIRSLCNTIANCHYHYNITGIAELISKADLAIGAGGTSTWERCCLGLPSIIISVADNQIRLAEDAHRKGCVIYIGDHSSITFEKIAQELKNALENRMLLEQISRNCLDLTDAAGVHKIVARLAAENRHSLRSTVDRKSILLRRAHENDLMQCFEWINDPVVRKNSFNPSAISIENHRVWFASKINDDNTVIYIMEYESVPVGIIRFDLADRKAKINYNIDKNYRGLGLGKLLLQMASEKLMAEMPLVTSVYGYVKNDNRPSIGAFQSAGFITAGTECVDGVESVLFVSAPEYSRPN